MRTYVRMIVCVYLPRFELLAAAGDRAWALQQALSGRALAVAPRPGSEQRVGEVSGAAEARGVSRGMVLGEALARCPDLTLIPANPVMVERIWEQTLIALESIGAAVEPAAPGLAYFSASGLSGLHGSLSETIDAAREALSQPARIGVAPTRFCSLAGALAARSRRPLVLSDLEARRWLSGRPVTLLALREETAELVEPLTRLGVQTLGELVRLGSGRLADRFGEPGSLAYRLACGQDGPLRPRQPTEQLQESMEVGDASSGIALKRILGVLVSRLLSRPERRGRTLRAAELSAQMVAGGSWRERVVFRQALSDPERICLALSVRLDALPAPAQSLSLGVERFGPGAGEQGGLFERDGARSAHRAARLREAIAQVRAVAGRDGALRAVCVDEDSRVPERRVVLAPIGE
jgi:protein ImuB